MARHFFRIQLALVLMGLAFASQAHAQLPRTQLFAIYPAGGQQGTTVELKITSSVDTDDARALHFNHSGIVAKQAVAAAPFRAEPQPVAGAFKVTISPDTPPGAYDVHVIGKYGVSNPRRFVVGDMQEVLEQEPNNNQETATPTSINSVVNGTMDGPALDWFKFDAQAGQRVVIECLSERIDSEADATLTLYDASGAELDNNRDRQGRDPFIDFTAPVDGAYYFTVHDFLYRGGPQVYYRARVSTRPSIDFIFPSVATRGATNPFTVYGRNLPGGELTSLTAEGRPLEKLDVEISAPAEAAAPLPASAWLVAQQSVLDAFEYRLSVPSGNSNPVLIGLTELPIVLETEPNNEAAQVQKINPPCEVVGQFYPERDHDRFQFTANKGDVYWINVLSRRLSRPTDPSLLVQQVTVDAEGKETLADIVEVDDIGTSIIGLTFNTTTEDPSYRFVAPADGQYRILLRNLAALADDPRNVYRLCIARPSNDFRLVATPRLPTADANAARASSLFLRRGGRDLLYVGAHRMNGFAGEIQLSVEGVPPGVTSPGGTILPGQSTGTIPLACTEDAAEWVGEIKIVGKAKDGDNEITRNADVGYVVWPNAYGVGRHVSRVADDLMLATSAGETAPLTVELGDGKPCEMSRGGQLQVPVRVTRRGTIKTPITLTPIDLPANVEAAALAFDANTNEGVLTLNIKKEAAVGEWDLVLLASATISYARNPEAVVAATAANHEIAAAAAKLAEEVKTAEAAVQAVSGEAAEQVAAKAAAEKKVAEAKAQAKAADDAKVAAEKRVAELTQAAAAKDLAIVEPSGTVRLKITPAPIVLEPLTISVKQGERVESPVPITRLYGFNDGATLEIVTSDEIKNSPEAKLLKIEAKPIAAGQNAGAVVVEAAVDTKAGATSRVLAATVKFNGQDLRIEQRISITVQAAGE